MADHRLPNWAAVLTAIVAAVLGGVAGALITKGDKVVDVRTRTVQGPTITEYQTIDVGAGRPCSGNKVARQPPYEPNEIADNAFGPLSATEPIEAALENDGDIDFYAFCLERPTEVGIRVQQTDCRLLGTTEDEFEMPDCSAPNVELRDDAGKALDDIYIDQEATIGTLQPKNRPAGRYYVRITNADGFLYQLELLAAEPSAVSRAIPK